MISPKTGWVSHGPLDTCLKHYAILDLGYLFRLLTNPKSKVKEKNECPHNTSIF